MASSGSTVFWEPSNPTAQSTASGKGIPQKPSDNNTDDFKPDSKTQIARAYGTAIGNLPVLRVMEVAIYTKKDQSPENAPVKGMFPVRSKRLREKCLREVIDLQMKPTSGRIAINFDAGRGWLSNRDGKTDGIHIVDHLIQPRKLGEQVDSLVVDEEMQLEKTKFRIGKTDKALDIFCKCIHKEDLQPGKFRLKQEEKYAKCFDILFHAYANADENMIETANKRENLSEEMVYANPFEFGNLGIKARLRPRRPAFDTGATKVLRIHVDIDVVVVTTAVTSVKDILEHHFGRPLPDVSSLGLAAIRKAIRGVPVLYKFPEKLSAHEIAGRKVSDGSDLALSETGGATEGENVNRYSRKQDEGTSEAQATCTIRDIKLGSEMNRIFVEIGSSCKSLKDVLRMQNASVSNISRLPLANIGRKKDFWVPIEDLSIAEEQILKPSKRFMSLFNSMSEGQIRLVMDICKRDVDALYGKAYGNFASWGLHVDQPVMGNWAPCRRIKISTPQAFPKRENAAQQAVKKESLAIIYVTEHTQDSEKFLETVKARLEHSKQRLTPFSSVESVTIPSLGSLIRQSDDKDRTSKLWKTTCNPPCTVVMGIIDRSGISRTRYKEIEAEIKRIGDRKFGAVTVCVQKQRLDNLLRCERAIIFPNNILRKINLMLGHPVWKTGIETIDQRVSNFDPSNSIVLGAHVSHPGSVSTDGCPSVAAVVSNLDQKFQIYPGSVQLQAHRPNMGSCEISGLGEMAMERFQAWKHARGSGATAKLTPKVFFYRGSYNTQSGDAYAKELKALQRAYTAVFRTKDVRLAYIIVSRHHHRHWTPNHEADVPFTFTTMGHHEEEGSTKYQYAVIHNFSGNSREELANLTTELNSSNQLGHCSSKALPVMYAHKLSRRVYDHFRIFSHKDLTNVPYVARKITEHDEQAQSGDSFRKFAQGYLFSDTVRNDGKRLPWKPSLDNKMFYL